MLSVRDLHKTVFKGEIFPGFSLAGQEGGGLKVGFECMAH